MKRRWNSGQNAIPVLVLLEPQAEIRMFAGWQERRFIMPGDRNRGLHLEEVPGNARQLKFE